MKRSPVRPLAWLILATALAVLVRAQPAPAPAAVPALIRFQDAITAFKAADRAHPPATHGILFVGSSIFREWTNVPEMMAPLPVLNRAFGGSWTQDQLDRFNEVVLPYAPRIIVYYCGSNDLKDGQLPDDIFPRFRTFSARVRAELPGTRLVFVSSTRSPDRVDKWNRVNRYNQLVRDYCAVTPGHTFIDLNPVLEDASGNPRLELYRDDKLHFQPTAYTEFTKVIKPVLEGLWAEVSASPAKAP